MAMIDEFLQEVRSINWFQHSKKAADKYHVIYSIFEAYDDWNEQIVFVNKKVLQKGVKKVSAFNTQ
ncbi:hypothetical protein [Faecalibacterium sp. An121]|uniref:hypothetical protein n=1 Tax=Faecalibacterium sp. An121 TaxID=1965550 RepID=UPI00117B6BA8|nr:hypothetical protein [Faecalibacterium sp. An121]